MKGLSFSAVFSASRKSITCLSCCDRGREGGRPQTRLHAKKNEKQFSFFDEAIRLGKNLSIANKNN